MIVITTSTVEGRPVQQYLGIVTGEVIVGANLFRDLFASVRDIVGGRSGSYEDVLARARMQALQEMQDMDNAVKSFDAAPFKHLRHAQVWLPQLANRTYLDMEQE